MESQNIEFRAVIKFLTKEGAKAKEIHRCMADVYGDSSPKYSTVTKWSAEFKRGRDSLEDDPRPGRLASVISQEMIDRVERLVLNNRRIRVAKLAWECGISNKSVYTIIHEHLGTSKVSPRWVPRNLNTQDRQQRVESRTSGSVQCQTRRLSHSSCNRRWNGFTTGTQILEKSPCNGSALAHPHLRNFVPNHQPAR